MVEFVMNTQSLILAFLSSTLIFLPFLESSNLYIFSSVKNISL